MTLIAISHNSWFHLYKPQLVDTRAGLSCYEPPYVTFGVVPNTNTIRTLDIRLKTSLATTYDCLSKWRPFVWAGYQYHQATTREHHVFTLHSEPQLKEGHSEPQLKECLQQVSYSKLSPQVV